MKNELMSNLSRGFGKFGLKVKKRTPEILLGAGIVGGVASAVLACKATTKVSTILDDTKHQVDCVHQALEDPNISEKEYSEEDGKKDLAIIYVQTGIKLAKLYAPAVGLGVLSIASILSSHNMMHKRNVAVSAAYMAVSEGFKDYRRNVVDRFGEALDRELKYNIKSEEIEETTVDEQGNEVTTKKTVEVMQKPLTGSEYAQFFDDGCTGWSKNPERNKKFLLDQQRYANDKLRARGYLFLNEVYEMLGMNITKAGQVVGWVYDPKSETLSNCVDFGIFDIYKEENRDFVNGRERTILLDFNVDGNVLDLMDVNRNISKYLG